ncbi:MAG: CotH kinase family protein [Dehalococcoidia bacterium]
MIGRNRHLAWRRNWWLILALGAFTAGMLVLMGSETVVPYTASKALADQTRADGAAKATTIAEARGLPGRNVKNIVDVFDVGVVHAVEITMDPVEYDTMITNYQRDGLKTWHRATVVIDGVRLERVGIRLKGNSTLVGLRYSGPESPPNPGGLAAILGKILADEPHKMPFLLRFDQFVPGQRYQGVNEVALRTAGAFGDTTQLTELLANLLTKESGQPYLRTSTATMRMNGFAEGYFLLVEHPDDYWAQRTIPGNQEPAVYKAIPGASFRYLGDDPARYGGVFNQQAETRSIGPGPMIDFLKFVETSSDQKFAANLADRLDVKEFARYLVFHNLIVDTDSFAGTGNNYYFLYDPRTRLMSIAAWDQNSAFGLLGGVEYRPYYEDGAAIPDFALDLGGVDELNDGGTGLGEENLLVKRFLATPKFRKLYDQTYRELFDRLLESGRVEALILEVTPPIQAAVAERGLVDASTFDRAAEGKRRFIASRIEYLATHPIIAD